MTSSVLTSIVVVAALGLATPTVGPRDGTAPGAPAAFGGPPDSLVANPAATTIQWRGTGLGGRGVREGTVALASGLLVIRHERLTSGNFTLNMRSLEGTMRGPAFLDVERHPTAEFRSTGATRVGQERWRVAGDLTLRGVTRPISFLTDMRWPETGHLVATSTFTIDRRQWGIGEGAPGVTDAVMDDPIRISISLDARRKQPRIATR